MMLVPGLGIVIVAVLTGWVCQIVRVNERVFHGVRRVDVDSAMAERVLQGSRDADIAISVTVHEQELDLSNGTIEDF